MRNFVILFITATLLTATSCRDVVYREPQPAGVQSVSTIPVEVQGIYKDLTVDETDGPAERWMNLIDTAIILYSWKEERSPFLEGLNYEAGEEPEVGDEVQNMIRGEMVDMTYVGDGWATYITSSCERIGIGDSVVIKPGEQGTWYVNLQEEEQDLQVWRLLLVEQLRNKDLIFWTPDEEEAEFAGDFFGVEEYKAEGYSGTVLLAAPKRKEMEKYISSGGYQRLLFWMSRDFERYSVPEEVLK